MTMLTIHHRDEEYFWGPDLTLARESLGLSQEEFAEKCGWKQQFQSKLELPGIRHRLSKEKRNAFTSLGIKLIPKQI